MKKHIIDFEIVENRHIHALYSLLVLRPVNATLPEEILPASL